MPDVLPSSPAPAVSPAPSPALPPAAGTPATDDTDPFQSAAPDVATSPPEAEEPEAATPPAAEVEATTETPEAEASPEAGDEVASTPPAANAPAPEFDIAIPLPGEFAPRNPDGTPTTNNRMGTLDIAFPTQEARDAIAFHVKRSSEFDAVVAEAQAGVEARAALTHLNTAPDRAMYQLEQVKPDAAKAYVENWMQRNPVAAAVAVRDLLGYAVEDNGNADRLTDKAELAKLKANEALREGQASYQQTVAREQYVAAGRDTIRTLAVTAGIDLQSRAGQYVAQQLAAAFDQHFPQHPSASKADLAALPVVRDILNDYQRLVGTPATPPAKAAVKPAAATGPAKFAQQAQAAKQAQRLAPGQTRIAALRAEKFKRGTTLDDLP